MSAVDPFSIPNWELDDEMDMFDNLADILDDSSQGDQCSLQENVMNAVDGKDRTSCGKASKKRKQNPDSEIIAAVTAETLKSLEVDPNSKEGKAKRRQIRNRLSAQFHRDRKNAHIVDLEGEMNRTKAEVVALREQVAALMAENNLLRSKLPGYVPPTHNTVVFAGARTFDSAFSVGHTDGESDAGSRNQPHGRSNTISSVSDASSLGSSPNASPHYTPSYQESPVIRSNVQSVPRPISSGPLFATNGIARPFTFITMMCMVSLMLFSGVQVPNGSTGLTRNRLQMFADFLANDNINSEIALRVGKEMLSLVDAHGTLGLIESRSSDSSPAREERRRLLDDALEEVASLAVVVKENKSAPLMTEVKPTAVAIREDVNNAAFSVHSDMAKLNIRSNGTNSQRQNLRRSYSDMNAENSTQSKRMVLATGIVNGKASNEREGALIPHFSRPVDSYTWPDSASFDYATVQSFSKVVLTQGQALLDPALSLSHGPRKSWVPSVHSNGPVLVKKVDATLTRQNNAPPLVITTPPAGHKDSHALVPTSAQSQRLTAVHTISDEHREEEHAHDVNDGETFDELIGGLLPKNNFMTLKLPATSIRVGKNWADSKMGTLEAIMEVFNITTGSNQDVNFSATHASTSVELNCVILGAKLVVSDGAQ